MSAVTNPASVLPLTDECYIHNRCIAKHYLAEKLPKSFFPLQFRSQFSLSSLVIFSITLLEDAVKDVI